MASICSSFEVEVKNFDKDLKDQLLEKVCSYSDLIETGYFEESSYGTKTMYSIPETCVDYDEGVDMAKGTCDFLQEKGYTDFYVEYHISYMISDGGETVFIKVKNGKRVEEYSSECHDGGQCPYCHELINFDDRDDNDVIECYGCGSRIQISELEDDYLVEEFDLTIDNGYGNCKVTRKFDKNGSLIKDKQRKNTSSKWKYSYANENIIIEKYTGKEKNVVVPETIDGEIVTSIGNSAFERCTNLQSITIPDSVTSIGSNAFEECESLQSITIPDSVTSIGGNAFNGCRSLQSITIPESVTSIGHLAFVGCTSLQSITIPESVTSISNFAFLRCTSLQSITIPDGVTSIGGWAFAICTSLQSITIPDSVTSIGKYAFEKCESVVFSCSPGSYAEQYAKRNHISYENV